MIFDEPQSAPTVGVAQAVAGAVEHKAAGFRTRDVDLLVRPVLDAAKRKRSLEPRLIKLGLADPQRLSSDRLTRNAAKRPLEAKPIRADLLCCQLEPSPFVRRHREPVRAHQERRGKRVGFSRLSAGRPIPACGGQWMTWRALGKDAVAAPRARHISARRIARHCR